MGSRDYTNGSLNGPSEYSYKRKFNSLEPSKVLHISNLPFDTTERELNQFCSPFGVSRKIMIIKNKNQAFIEMESEYDATNLMDYFQIFDIHLRSNKIVIQYSNHKNLSVKHDNDYDDTYSKTNTSPVLHVKIDNMSCPITIDVLYQIFSKNGQVMKIATYNKLGEFGALIQYSDSFTASNARTTLNGQNIYNNCCKLRIDFHKKDDLHISPNDPLCRDYTLPLNDRSILNNPIFNNMPNIAAASMLGPQLLQNVIGVNKNSLSPNNDFNMRNDKRMKNNNSSNPPTPVLLASNLSKEMSTPDKIFALFGAFGDVQKVKVLYNKRDAALVQMMDTTQAGMVLDFLHGSIVFGKEIRITSSKYHEISFPAIPLNEEGSSDDENGEKRLLTKDYTNSPLHRYRKAGSKNYNNICPPSCILHISNIPSTLTEDDIKHIFKDSGFFVDRFKFFPKTRSMALVRLSTEEDGIKALVLLNNYTVSGEKGDLAEKHLRISFSPSKM
ncbi:unnamed protein product [Gordionus sp. m RMFG-2023]|uniref:polypyrimidine tract-binding protein 2-like n=1 Tax=Gordionus sp. m RMFG-2023 TaxID=3053472 RepID=UPI0030E1C884